MRTISPYEALRDELVRLLGGVGKPSGSFAKSADFGKSESVGNDEVGKSKQINQTVTMYDVIGNERHKAVCRLREWEPDEDGMPRRELWEAVMGEELPTVPLKGDAELDIIMRDRLVYLLGGDECNFSVVKSNMDAMGEKSNPAETSDASTDHVSFDTRLKLKTYAYIILEFADTLGIDYPNGSKITDVAVEIRKRLSVLMSKSASLTKSAEIAKSDADDGGEVRRITDELRDFVADRMTRGTMYVTLPDVEPETQLTEEGYKLIAIADRIDEQFARVCEQQEAVLQATIDEMAYERCMLQAKLDAIRGVLDGR